MSEGANVQGHESKRLTLGDGTVAWARLWWNLDQSIPWKSPLTNEIAGLARSGVGLATGLVFAKMLQPSSSVGK